MQRRGRCISASNIILDDTQTHDTTHCHIMNKQHHVYLAVKCLVQGRFASRRVKTHSSPAAEGAAAISRSSDARKRAVIYCMLVSSSGNSVRIFTPRICIYTNTRPNKRINTRIQGNPSPYSEGRTAGQHNDLAYSAERWVSQLGMGVISATATGDRNLKLRANAQ